MLAKISHFIQSERKNHIISSFFVESCNGNLKKVKQRMAQLRARGILIAVLNTRERGDLPLWNALFHSTCYGGPPHYAIGIEMLEAGAKPEALDPTGNMSVYHMPVLERNLSMLRLLLWYESDDPRLQFETYEIHDHKSYRILNNWCARQPDLMDRINETTRDFRAARQLLKRNDEILSRDIGLLPTSLLIEAGLNFSKVADTCIKYREIEAKIDQPGADVLSGFYADKARGFQEKAYGLLKGLDHSSPIDTLTSLSREERKAILNKLNQLATALGQSAEAMEYDLRLRSEGIERMPTVELSEDPLPPFQESSLYHVARLVEIDPDEHACVLRGWV